jgi:hypothetical protein
MMDVYIYQAALLCPDCARKVMAHVPLPRGADPGDESIYDSDYCPKGPYRDGGGEADTPQHCDHCGVFLENPLTDDGYSYVADVLARDEGAKDVLDIWQAFYWEGQDND